ncbi:MAG TPA: hypothetical protein VGM03_08010 [Phycisphaerae bacterium]
MMHTNPTRALMPLLVAALASPAVAQPPAKTPEKASDRQPANGHLPASFTLGRYVPDNAWMLIDSVHNPERDFIDRHWARVFEAVKQSGAADELKNVIAGNMQPDERERFEQVWQTVTRLYNSVQWSQLASTEFAFAQRFRPALGPPEMFFLMRGAPDATEANFNGLKGILETVSSAAPDELKLSDQELMGARVCGLDIAGAMTIDLIRRGDIIAVTSSRSATTEMLSLIGGAGQKPEAPTAHGAVFDSPRFQQALAVVTAPEDSVAWFDLQQLFTNVRAMFTPRCPKGDAAAHDEFVMLKVMSAAANELDIFDAAISTEWTDGLQTRSDSYCNLRADAAGKPLTRLFAVQKPFGEFDHFVPAEVTGFSVSSGWDLALLYDIVIDFIKNNAPDGESSIREWEAMLAGLNFDPKHDLLDWLGGETVSTAFPASGKSLFGSGGEWVEFVRVKDTKQAAVKIDAAVNKINELLGSNGKPTLIVEASPEVKAGGFRSLTHPIVMMMGLRIHFGFSADWLVVGSSASAINKCLEAGAGKRPTVSSNPRFQKEGIVPNGPVVSASFTDLSHVGEDWGSAAMMSNMITAFIPDQPETRPIRGIIAALGRLGPALLEINFFSSESSATSFDGQAWRTKTVTTYRNPPAAD